MRQIVLISALFFVFPIHAQTQGSRPNLEGMWSDLPAGAENNLCLLVCTDEGVEYLMGLLDDSENLDRPFIELQVQTWAYQVEEITPKYLTPAALESYPLDMAEDPGLVDCEPWGYARQIFVPHQLQIQQYNDRIEMYYAEWEARRTIYLESRERPENETPSRMGFSVGHFEGDTLVVETTGVSSNIFEGITLGAVEHSDQLRGVERYTLAEDGNRLDLIVTFEDPLTLREPLVLRRGWAWAPDEEIFEYVCELPDQ